MQAAAIAPKAPRQTTAKRKPRVMGSNSAANSGEVSRCAIRRTAASASETGFDRDNPHYSREPAVQRFSPVATGAAGPVVFPTTSGGLDSRVTRPLSPSSIDT